MVKHWVEPGLQELARADETLGDFACDWREDGNLSGVFWRLFHQSFGIADAEGAKPIGGGF